MLVRVYRVTDRFGLVLLKLAGASGEWLLDGASVISAGTRGGASGILTILLGILSLIFSALDAIFQLLKKVFLAFLSMVQIVLETLWKIIRRVLRLGSAAGGTVVTTGMRVSGQTARTASGNATEAMARRSARAELEASLTEDPLKAQNRRLSFFIVLLSVVVIGVVLWATDPARTGTPLIPNNSDVASSFLAPTAESEDTNQVAPASVNATPIPTATPIPETLQVGGTLAYVLRERGQEDIWAVEVGSRNPIRITNDVADERDPTWSPPTAPGRLAYASNKDGNWELYIYDINSGTTDSIRVTYDLSFQANPSWSPDGQWLVYESYQGDNLDIYAMPIDSSEAPVRITDHPAPDYSPAWIPDLGRKIAFVSLRDGNQDIFIFDLDTLETTNLTQSPNRAEDHPAWSPDGRFLAYSAWENGQEIVFVQSMDDLNSPPQTLGFGSSPSWSPNGANLTYAVNAPDNSLTYLSARPYLDSGLATEVISVPYGASTPTWTDIPLPISLVNSGGLDLAVTNDLYIEQTERTDGTVDYLLSPLLDVEAPNPVLSDAVNDSFNALRLKVAELSGEDFLGILDDAFWTLERRPQPGEERRNWHMTGRAFSIRRSILGFPPPIEVVREDRGINTFWRVYVRVSDDAQAGQLGEPLRHLPWDFESRVSGDPEAYDQGGRYRAEVPTGYYIDITEIAQDYGWIWTAAGSDWRANANSINYWLFRKPEGMTWYQGMTEIYRESQLGGFVPTATPQPVSDENSDEG